VSELGDIHKGPMHDLLPSTMFRTSQRLTRGVQVAILAWMALAVAAGVVVVPMLRDRSSAGDAAEPAAAATPGTFRPTPQQRAGFTLATIALVTFRSEHVTDGKIAINDDRTTPVFSPYSGRVARLFAKPGDSVERGAPLLEVEASEFVQAQNDLAAAAGALGKARSQLRLAETTERRQHELYEAKAGALKDWQRRRTILPARAMMCVPRRWRSRRCATDCASSAKASHRSTRSRRRER
jgi:membrane fusion protein, heavy metal efflux system